MSAPGGRTATAYPLGNRHLADDIPDQIWWCRNCPGPVWAWGCSAGPPPRCPECKGSDFEKVPWNRQRRPGGRIDAAEVADRAAKYFALNAQLRKLRAVDGCSNWSGRFDMAKCLCILNEGYIREPAMCSACQKEHQLRAEVRKAQRSLYRGAKSWGTGQ